MNKTISRYINHNILFPKVISKVPRQNLGIVIVIPCFNEPDVVSSILSIAACNPPSCAVEVIISINAGEDSPESIKNANQKSKSDVDEMQNQLPDWLHVYAILNNQLPPKKAGVGLGRKIGMDEAVQRFVELEKQDGIIVCFDADSQCQSDYLVEIESHFQHPKIESASIHYEHPIEGDEFSNEIYDSIIQYELHLRYFIHIQKKMGLPYAYHTIGSSMACTVNAYCAVSGMNQRKAGEDFYFIHKLVKYGKHSELNSTAVIPSPRISDRVPFGTGKAVGKMMDSDQSTFYTYAPQSFYDLQQLVDSLPKLFAQQHFGDELPKGVQEFLESIQGAQELERILKNTSDYDSFYKMFWHWFDAFALMKYLHFVRDRWYPDIPVLEAVHQIGEIHFKSEKEALIYHREIDSNS